MPDRAVRIHNSQRLNNSRPPVASDSPSAPRLRAHERLNRRHILAPCKGETSALRSVALQICAVVLQSRSVSHSPVIVRRRSQRISRVRVDASYAARRLISLRSASSVPPHSPTIVRSARANSRHS